MAKKWVYSFITNKSDGNASQKALLGGKGANLNEMCRIGLPVPPGFTITTEACTYFYENEETYPKELSDQVIEAVQKIEKELKHKFGSVDNPLLLSVRSGARASMPGMMDTVLNLGLNDKSVIGLAKKFDNERFAYDSYRQFIQMYSDVVIGVEHDDFESILEDYKEDHNYQSDTDLNTDDLKKIVELYKECSIKGDGEAFPQNVWQQLWGSINAGFGSWNNTRARTYRRLHDVPDSWGTAVNVQSMVFGNRGDSSAKGVAFTRNPSTGENQKYGEYLINAQGDDVEAGIRTDQPLSSNGISEGESLENIMPANYKALVDVFQKLERHYKDMQDIDFTIEDGRLWILQTRNGKRTAKAAIKIAVDMAEEGLIDKKEAIMRIDAKSLDQLLHSTIEPDFEKDICGKGLPASPGAGFGEVVFTSEDVSLLAQQDRKAILVRQETSPEDIQGMYVSCGILTLRGGMTSHAAVVARGMGKPCVAGASGLLIDFENKELIAGDKIFKEGDLITLDGSRGEVICGKAPLIDPQITDDFEKLMRWSDEYKALGVRANAETPTDAKKAFLFGAQGIGLCRTEHMFFSDDRIVAFREMIFARTDAERRFALEKILPNQREDFEQLFEIMEGKPVTIRLLDPPLHEFLPDHKKEIKKLADELGIDYKEVRKRLNSLKEFNPMLGHRGCRLGVSFPQLPSMQARAIFEAMVQMQKKLGHNVDAEIMVPLVFSKEELKFFADIINEVAHDVKAKYNTELKYKIGTMIELPRACLLADEIAEYAEFFSFGTNDLTQTAYGISRDDAAGFLDDYRMKGIIEDNPFVTVDLKGVGELIKIGKERGKKANPNLQVGLCGEHGGNVKSIKFCHENGLDYISCSPFRVPGARLAAAQAAIEN